MVIVVSLILDKERLLLATIVITKEDGGGVEYKLVEIGTEYYGIQV